jgi:hypothetical protein
MLAAPRVARAQEAQADPLKFAASKPTVVGWVIKADKTAEFEAAWAGIRALLAKSDKDDLKAFGETLSHLYRVDQPPFDFQSPQGPVKAVMYVFRIDAPSTAYSYNPREILYVYLKAGQEGSPVTRAEADDLYTAKLASAYLAINPLWTLTRIGG